jgi:hypothetical protein
MPNSRRRRQEARWWTLAVSTIAPTAPGRASASSASGCGSMSTVPSSVATAWDPPDEATDPLVVQVPGPEARDDLPRPLRDRLRLAHERIIAYRRTTRGPYARQPLGVAARPLLRQDAERSAATKLGTGIGTGLSAPQGTRAYGSGALRTRGTACISAASCTGSATGRPQTCLTSLRLRQLGRPPAA